MTENNEWKLAPIRDVKDLPWFSTRSDDRFTTGVAWGLSFIQLALPMYGIYKWKRSRGAKIAVATLWIGTYSALLSYSQQGAVVNGKVND